MYLVMELCTLGELRTLLDRRGPFSEISTRHIIRDLTDAVAYLHKNDIVHRDLKLENILVACNSGNDDSPLYNIKVTDFGLSVVKGGVGTDSMLQSFCGTPIYMAPEVIQNHDYSQQCDMWSIGVIQYSLLSKEFPWMADKEDKLYDLIKKAEVDLSKPVWKSVSGNAKALIRGLLHVDPAHRLTAREVLESIPWVKGESASSTENPTNVLDMMKEFAEEQKNNYATDSMTDYRPVGPGQSVGRNECSGQELPMTHALSSLKISAESHQKSPASSIAHCSIPRYQKERRSSMPTVPLQTTSSRKACKSEDLVDTQKSSLTSSAITISGTSQKSPSYPGFENAASMGQRRLASSLLLDPEPITASTEHALCNNHNNLSNQNDRISENSASKSIALLHAPGTRLNLNVKRTTSPAKSRTQTSVSPTPTSGSRGFVQGTPLTVRCKPKKILHNP